MGRQVVCEEMYVPERMPKVKQTRSRLMAHWRVNLILKFAARQQQQAQLGGRCRVLVVKLRAARKSCRSRAVGEMCCNSGAGVRQRQQSVKVVHRGGGRAWEWERAERAVRSDAAGGLRAEVMTARRRSSRDSGASPGGLARAE